MSAALFDTHCHLTLISHLSLSEQIAALRQSKVTHLLDAGLSPTDFFQRKAHLAKVQSAAPQLKLFQGVALAPHVAHQQVAPEVPAGEITQQLPQWLQALEGLMQRQKPAALCEIGLDYVRLRYEKAFQRELLAAQLALAKRHGLAVFLHLRGEEEVFNDCHALLKVAGVQRGAVHCFTGSLGSAKKMLELGFHLSFSGIVTFKKAAYLREVAAFAPLERLLSETDAPYLAPVPHRGQPNTPAFLPYINRCLAAVRGIREEEMHRCLTQNALRLLGVEG